MIKIELSNINDIKDDFVKRVEDSIIKNKLTNLTRKEKATLKNETFENGSELQKRIHKLYKCLPNLLMQETVDFQNYLNNNHANEINDIKSTYFDYETTINYKKQSVKHAYWLMQKLNVRVCPYCNRSYTFTIIKGVSGSRPEFDHFHCQDNNPFLSLSFYNLIPSCPTCNHKKKISDIDIHPYIEGFDDNCQFKIDKIEKCLLDSDKYNEWNVTWGQHEKRFDSNIKTFLLTEFYNEHKDFISEIVFKTQAYNSGYYQTLIDTFADQALSQKEMHLLIFGTYLESDDLGLRPLSKLSKDIIKQVEVESL